MSKSDWGVVVREERGGDECVFIVRLSTWARGEARVKTESEALAFMEHLNLKLAYERITSAAKFSFFL